MSLQKTGPRSCDTAVNRRDKARFPGSSPTLAIWRRSAAGHASQVTARGFVIMTTASTSTRRLLYAAIGLAIVAAPAVAVFAGVGTPAPRMAAQCQDTDTEDSFSMNCAPTVIPDTSD